MSIQSFAKKGGWVDFSHKNEGVGKIGGCFRKGGHHLFSY